MKKLFLILLVFVSISTFAQNEPKDMVNKFFELYNSNGSDQAIDYIFSTNPLTSEMQPQIGQIKTSLRQTITLLGSLRTHEILSHKKAGSHFELITASGIYDRQPIRYEFSFYKPAKEWKLLNVIFDDKIEIEAH